MFGVPKICVPDGTPAVVMQQLSEAGYFPTRDYRNSDGAYVALLDEFMSCVFLHCPLYLMFDAEGVLHRFDIEEIAITPLDVVDGTRLQCSEIASWLDRATIEDRGFYIVEESDKYLVTRTEDIAYAILNGKSLVLGGKMLIQYRGVRCQ